MNTIKSRHIFYAAFFSFYILGIANMVILLLIPGGTRTSRDARVDKLGVCLEENDPESQLTKKVITLNKETIYICGELSTSIPTSLTIYIFREGRRKAIFTNPISEVFDNGPFYSQVPVEELKPPGNYQVTASIARIITGRTEFQIIDP